MVGYSGVGRGSGVEVRLGKSRLAWYGADLWVFWVQVGVVWSAMCLSWVVIGVVWSTIFRFFGSRLAGFIEAKLWNIGFFVCGFCWLMRFCLIYEVLFVGFLGPNWQRVCVFCLWVFWVQIGEFVLLLDFVSPPRRKWRLQRKLQIE